MNLDLKTLSKISVAVMVALAVFLLIARKDAEVPEENYPKGGTNIIAFGDSLVEGAGATTGNDFVSVLSQEIGVPIINAGRSGDTTVSAMTRLNDDVLNKDPKIVIIVLGGNDFLLRYPREQTANNLATMIDLIKAKGAAVILVGVQGDDFEDLAREKKVTFMPKVLDNLFGNREFMSDTIHPNDKGYRIIAERLKPYVQEMLSR